MTPEVMQGAWLLFNTPALPGPLNMAWDQALHETANQTAKPVLRFYSWAEPAATFGYFQPIRTIEAITPIRPLIRRTTGGGFVPHLDDWTYSLVIPRQHPWCQLNAESSYHQLHAWIQAAFHLLNIPTHLAPCCHEPTPGQCFVGHAKHDLLWHGRKIAGAAQRRNQNGLLIQGSLQPPPLSMARSHWESAMVRVLQANGAHPIDALTPTPQLSTLALSIANSTYASDTHNRRR